jgi:hypothetical protein
LVGIPGKTESVLVYDNANRAHYDGWLRPLHYTRSPAEMTLLVSVSSKITASEPAPMLQT